MKNRLTAYWEARTSHWQEIEPEPFDCPQCGALTMEPGVCKACLEPEDEPALPDWLMADVCQMWLMKHIHSEKAIKDIVSRVVRKKMKGQVEYWAALRVTRTAELCQVSVEYIVKQWAER